VEFSAARSVLGGAPKVFSAAAQAQPVGTRRRAQRVLGGCASAAGRYSAARGTRAGDVREIASRAPAHRGRP